MSSETVSNVGTIVSVRGSVVDVQFSDQLPPINSLLRAGKDGRIVIEAWAQWSAHLVRGIALTPTQGLVGQFNEAMAEFVETKLAALPDEKKIRAIGERICGQVADAKPDFLSAAPKLNR